VHMSSSLHGITDILLAPVVLSIDEQIEELSLLDVDELAMRVAVDADTADWTRDMREDALLNSIQHRVEVHDWKLSWDPRGVRLSHSHNTLVLGVPATFIAYLSGSRP